MKIVLFILLSLPLVTHAKLFTITSCSTSALICTAMEDSINAILPKASTAASLAQGMAKASVISQKGQGADYSSNMEMVAFGGGVGVGASLGDGQGITDLISGSSGSLPGIGIGSGVLIGINLSFLNAPIFKKSNLFVNFASITPPSSFGIGGSFNSFGIHYQYKLIEASSVGLGFFSFGGVDLTTGFEKGTSTLELSYKVDQTITGGAMTGTAVFATDTKTYSIPIEISTNAKILHIFTLFGGLGLDYNWGESTVAVKLQNATLDIGTPNLNLVGTGNPGSVTFRHFLGLQFDITVIKLAFQYNSGIGNGETGFNIGARFVW